MSTRAGPKWPTVARDDEMRRAWAALAPKAEYQGVALTGESGVGKSTLARMLADRLKSDGQTVRFALGTQTGCHVPLGAFSRSIALGDAHGPAAMLAAAHKTLGAEQNLVVVVDDAHLLDPLSATLVHQLAAGGGARVIMTIRSGEAPLDAVVALLKERLLLNLHVDPFTREHTGEFARGVLGDDAESALIDALHHRSGGSPLLLRGLLSAGRENGVLVHTDHGWRLHGPLRPDRELLDLLEFRLRSLPPDERLAMEVLAVAEVVDWEILREICDPDAVGRLEHRGLIQFIADGSGLAVQPNNPIFGEVALQLAGVLRARQVNGLLTQTLQRHLQTGRPHSGLPDVRARIRLAQFMVRSDVEPDIEVIISAAAHALAVMNLGCAEELARFAFQRDGDLRAALVLADTLGWQGRADEAEAVLAGVTPDDSDEMFTVRWGCVRAANLFWGCGDFEAAQRLLADVKGRARSEAGIALITALDAAYSFFSGNATPALQGGPQLCAPDATPLATVWASVPTSLALAGAGRLNDVPSIAAAGLRTDALSESGPLRFAIGVAEVVALIIAGDHPAAERVVERYAALAESAPEGSASVGALRGLVHLASGQLPQACSALRDSIPDSRHGYRVAWLVLTTAWLAQAEGARGDAAAAAAARENCEQAFGPQVAVFESELEMGRAWEHAAAGQTSAGRSHALRAAHIARRSGMSASEVRALHTAVRLGDRSQAGRLAELATELPTVLTEAIATHARGLADHDGDLLDTAADRFANTGALALAADAAAQAAAEHARRDHHSKRLKSSARAHQLADQGDIHTPAVNAAAEPLPLTDRQREIVALVAAGLSNRQIAEHLCVSVRTVDGHLYRIFDLLGIERRDQLTDLLGRPRSAS